MFREVPLLMKVGVIMMSLALVLVIAAVVVRVTLGSEPGWLVAAEVATKSPGQALHYSSGEQGSATNKSSSEKVSPRYPSGKVESMGYGSSSSSDGPVEQRKEDAKEPQAMVQREAELPNSQSPMPQQGASKLLLMRPLGHSPNHNSPSPNHNSTRHNKNNPFCQAPNDGTGQSPPKQS